jgi:hypothetical protein
MLPNALAHSLLRERSEAPNIGPIEPWVGLHCALRQIRTADVRFGSLADIEVLPTDVRFTPESGHRNSVVEYPLCAKSGHCGTPAIR